MIHNICHKCKKDYLSFVVSQHNNSYCDDCRKPRYRPLMPEKLRREKDKMQLLSLDDRVIMIRNNKSRNMLKVILKCELIKELRYIHKLSFPAIGKLLDNDHSTIVYLFHKHRNGYSYNGVVK